MTPKNAAKTEPKSRTRVVSLRIPDDTYDLICKEATRRNISPSKLLTYIVTSWITSLREYGERGKNGTP